MIRTALLRLAAERAAGKTFCPSEVARELAETGWRDLMPEVRAVAEGLVQAGQLRCWQGGQPAWPLSARGPIRLSR